MKTMQINAILEHNFFIPSYQRGYRWEKQQVEDLLNDIWEFIIDPANDKDKIYCLQPLVVKKKGEQWEVIDGQQRLITIFLILSYLGKRKRYGLEFETRPESKHFLDHLTWDIDETNIDFYHISVAYAAIKDWFTEKGKRDKMENTLQDEFSIGLGRRAYIIWYEVEEQLNSIDIFTRINMGKIPLTNAELIKALFLKRERTDRDPENLRLKQLEIGSEWDRIEYALQDKEFWYFLQDDERAYVTRIEFILDLIAMDKGSAITREGNRFFSFLVFDRWLKEADSTDEAPKDKIWREVKRYFMTFEDWYKDWELYHLVGYLVATGTRMSQLKKEATGKSKDAFKRSLVEKALSNVGDGIDDLVYGDSQKVRKVLLLFNIATILNNKEAYIRFPFDRYKIDKWDIEHIHALQAVIPDKKNHQFKWLEEISMHKDILSKLNNEQRIQIAKFLEDTEDDLPFAQLYTSIVTTFGDGDNVNDISNLTLLDAGTNRGYKNAPFPIKRKVILEKDRTNTFIPTCTKNVFLKYYSHNIDQMHFWGKEDRAAYLATMTDTIYALNQFLTKEN